MNVKETILAAIQDENYTPTEMMRFMEDPRDALLAGAAIGYRLGLLEQRETLSQLQDAISKIGVSVAQQIKAGAK